MPHVQRGDGEDSFEAAEAMSRRGVIEFQKAMKSRMFLTMWNGDVNVGQCV